jgi:negative regulator of flagellin synthesis FlgM
LTQTLTIQSQEQSVAPGEIKVTNRISDYKATEPPAPVKSVANGSSAIADKAQAGVTAAAAAPPASTADTVSITGSGLTLQKLSEAVANAPVVNTQKVATVRQAVQGGTYQVDTGRVADKIIQFESGLQ